VLALLLLALVQSQCLDIATRYEQRAASVVEPLPRKMRLQRLLIAGESLPDAGKIYLLTAVQ
jgi:hypothetical protein